MLLQMMLANFIEVTEKVQGILNFVIILSILRESLSFNLCMVEFDRLCSSGMFPNKAFGSHSS